MTPGSEAPADGVTPSSLRARLRIEPHPDAGCAVLDAGARGERINQNEVCRDGSCADGCQCRVEVTVTEEEHAERQLVGSAVEDRCICPVFRQNDCVFEIESFQNSALFVSVSVPTRRALRDIVEGLREREASVHLEQILPLSNENGTQTIELDANSITDKQRKAIETAVRAGYYQTPRTASLDDLADELGVSRSAVSQRINAAESKLVQELVGARSDELSQTVDSD